MSNINNLFPDASNLMSLLIELKESESLSLVEKLLTTGVDPLHIVQCCQAGMRDVGKHYETGRYYLSGLMMAGEISRQVMEMVLPILQERVYESYSGRILIGTIEGDIHDIGKNLVAMLLRCHGFNVMDLGVDVPPRKFVQQANKFRPDIIAISALLTTAQDLIKETIKLFADKSEKKSKNYKIIIGGGFMNELVCQYIGADFWARDAISGVRYCQKIISPAKKNLF